MHISNKAISLVAAVSLIAAQLLTPVAAYAESDQAAVDQVEATAAEDNLESENPYLSEFSGSSFRYENGNLREDIEPIATFSIPQWPDNATGWGIDVSYAQGQIDWAKVKAAGCDFAILRCGYGSGGNDRQFKKNVEGCKANGIPFGVYLYSYAWDAGIAKQEADWTLKVLSDAGVKPSDLSLPVYYDLENEVGNRSHPAYGKPAGVDGSGNYRVIEGGPATFASIANSYCSAIQRAGYKAGVYANLNWWNNYLSASDFNSWDRWVAQYNSTCDYAGRYSIWQYSSRGTIDGISGTVDVNWWYGPEFGGSNGTDSVGSLVSYEAHVQNIGWQPAVFDGAIAGTTGRNLNLESLDVNLGNDVGSGEIEVKAHVSEIGWQDWTTGKAGTVGRNLPIEALQIRLAGDVAQNYDVWYRVHSADFGWLGWAKNGQSAGSQGFAKSSQAVQIVLTKKGAAAPGDTNSPFKARFLNIQTHVQNIGWQTPVSDGMIAGTTGRALHVEALKLSLGPGIESGGIQVRAHVSNIGWQDWTSSMAGTTGRNLAVEAVQIRLNGAAEANYDVWYRVHSSELGWLGWTKNGENAGSEGYARSVEALQVSITPKGASAPGSTARPFVKR